MMKMAAICTQCRPAPDDWTSWRYDEVSGEVFCAEHAGPLAWSDHDVDMYSLALRVCGEVDKPYDGVLGRAASS